MAKKTYCAKCSGFKSSINVAQLKWKGTEIIEGQGWKTGTISNLFKERLTEKEQFFICRQSPTDALRLGKTWEKV